MLKMKSVMLALVAMLLLGQGAAYGANVSISIKHPGGNVLVGAKSGNTINVAPDLRGGRDWFYWNFDATADGAGEVKFQFKGTQVGPQGPAYSTDGGKTWQWLGPEGASGSEFVYNFEKKGQTVRFAVAIPYQLANLNEFLATQKGNPLLTQSVLTKTRHGRDVPLLQIGQPGPGKDAIIMTGRHHACESMVSYALEGLMGELLSDSYTSKEFLKKYVVYVVPMVDLDGVEEGDQGKDRAPHDHNRDYLPNGTNLYPETGAIMKLADDKKIHFAMDFHCPALRGDVHYAFYYDGPKFDHTASNMNEMIKWQAEEGPPVLGNTLNFMKKITPNRTPMNSDFFGYRPDVINAATIEVPYSRPGTKLTEDMIRAYGVAMLKAWLHTVFSRDPAVDRGIYSYAAFTQYRTDINNSLNNPARFKELTDPYLNNADAPGIYRVESNLALLRLAIRQKDTAAYAKYSNLVLNDPAATAEQKMSAKIFDMTMSLALAGKDSVKVQAAIDKALAIPYLSKGEFNTIYSAARDFFKSQKMYEQAIKYTELQADVGLDYRKGSTMLEVADMLDALNKPEQALAKRKEAVAWLRDALDPVPPNGTTPIMGSHLLQALDSIPTSTKQEKIQVIELVLAHKDTGASQKAEFTRRLAELQK